MLLELHSPRERATKSAVTALKVGLEPYSYVQGIHHVVGHQYHTHSESGVPRNVPSLNGSGHQIKLQVAGTGRSFYVKSQFGTTAKMEAVITITS